MFFVFILFIILFIMLIFFNWYDFVGTSSNVLSRIEIEIKVN